MPPRMPLRKRAAASTPACKGWLGAPLPRHLHSLPHTLTPLTRHKLPPHCAACCFSPKHLGATFAPLLPELSCCLLFRVCAGLRHGFGVTYQLSPSATYDSCLTTRCYGLLHLLAFYHLPHLPLVLPRSSTASRSGRGCFVAVTLPRLFDGRRLRPALRGERDPVLLCLASSYGSSCCTIATTTPAYCSCCGIFTQIGALCTRVRHAFFERTTHKRATGIAQHTVHHTQEVPFPRRLPHYLHTTFHHQTATLPHTYTAHYATLHTPALLPATFYPTCLCSPPALPLPLHCHCTTSPRLTHTSLYLYHTTLPLPTYPFWFGHFVPIHTFALHLACCLCSTATKQHHSMLRAYAVWATAGGICLSPRYFRDGLPGPPLPALPLRIPPPLYKTLSFTAFPTLPYRHRIYLLPARTLRGLAGFQRSAHYIATVGRVRSCGVNLPRHTALFSLPFSPHPPWSTHYTLHTHCTAHCSALLPLLRMDVQD